MAEENRVMTDIEATMKDPKEVTTGPKEVTTKDSMRVQQGKNLAEWNRKNKKVQKSEVSQYYGIGVVLAVGVIGGLGYYLYHAKVNVKPPPMVNNSSQQHHKVNKFEME